MNERLTDPSEAQRWLTEETGITDAVAEQIINYVKETRAVSGMYSDPNADRRRTLFR